MKQNIKQWTGQQITGGLARLKNSIAGTCDKTMYSVLIDSTNGCNLRCAFCTRNNDKIAPMKTEEFDAVLSKIHKQISALQLSCAWEYSIASNAPEIIRAVGKYKIPSTTIYTNGNILSDAIAGALIDAGLNNFVVSIGEAKKETYEKLRRGGKFEKVIANIRKLDRLKKERKSLLPLICSNLTVVNSNADELVDFVDLARSLGIQRIIGRHLILNKGINMENERIKDKARLNRILDMAKKKADSYGMSFSIPRYEDTLKSKQCRAPWNQLYISCNGDVSVCPRIHVYAKIGNFFTDSVNSIIDGGAIAALRKQFDERNFNNPVCGVCMDNLETEVAIDQGF